jgi:hypothetical protein
MQFHSIRAGELQTFVESDLFRKLSAYPITYHRALSQAKNPRALSDDIVLIIAYSDDFELLGYIGALPDDISVGGNRLHVAWNSCWWSHPEKGKPVVIKLFAAMQKAWNYQMCFSDLTEQGKNFLEVTNKYNFNAYPGYKFILRFYFAKLVASKSKYLDNPLTKIILGFVDFWLNSIISLIQYSKYPFDTDKVKVDKYQTLPNDVIPFIENRNNWNIAGRNKPEFDWILQNPWILMHKQSREQYSGKYFFSHTAKSFQTYFLIFRESKKNIAVFLIQERDGQYSLPYAFFDKDKLSIAGNGLLNHLLRCKAHSLVTYQPDLVKFFSDCNIDITKKNLVRYAAFPKEMETVPESVYIQDGDGDAVFC